jgi:hypothetical protein
LKLRIFWCYLSLRKTASAAQYRIWSITIKSPRPTRDPKTMSRLRIKLWKKLK